jgi:hypothetical protein
MNPFYLHYGTAGLALLLVLLRLRVVFLKLNIHTGAFSGGVIRLIGKDDIDRAIKLCRAAPGAVAAAAVGAVLEAWDGGMRDRRSLRSEVDSKIGGIDEIVGQGMIFSPFGALFGSASIILAWYQGLGGTPFQYIALMGGAAIVGALLGEIKARRIAKAAHRAVDRVIEALREGDSGGGPVTTY